MNIVLIGLKSCGKTSVGTYLSQIMRCGFVDTDRLIQAHYAILHGDLLSTTDIYAIQGAQYFRRLETSVIGRLKTMSNTIIASGGGSILDAVNRKMFKKTGIVVYLQMSYESFCNRIQSQSLPSFIDANDPVTSMQCIYQERILLYQQIADIEISTDNQSIEEIGTAIKSQLKGQYGF
ncbi:MAG TPA: shikimate kinase [Legionellaceae bacterium]|nr:shikimate kinase [Legionellaceae bacterium]